MAKSISERKAELERKKAALLSQLKDLERREAQQSRKQDAREKIVVGGAVLAHARIDQAFAATLLDVLKKAVTRDKDVKTIEAVIAELEGQK